MKKLVALLLAGVMTLSLAACGNQSSKSEDKKETSKSEETVEISFWHAMSGANEEAIQKITERVVSVLICYEHNSVLDFVLTGKTVVYFKIEKQIFNVNVR